MENKTKINLLKPSVHKVLAHSYIVFFVFFLVSIYLDLVFNLKFFNYSVVVPLGFILLILATFLIIWAQKTSRNLKKENISQETFCHGPYRYTRSPTHLGLFLLMLGFGLINNAFFIILFSFLALIFTKLIFLNKEERILTEKYGTAYLEYKKMVRF